MKIAIISRNFLPDIISGRETLIFNLWKLFSNKHETSLIVGWENSDNLLPKDAYKVHLSSNNKYINYLKLFNFVKKVINEIKPDVILSNSIEVPTFSFLKTVVIIYDFNFGKSSSGTIPSTKRLFLKMKLKTFDKIIAVSNVTKRKVIDLGINANKIVTIHPGVDTDKFRPIMPENKKFTIVCPSRILFAKGQHIAIEAVRIIDENIRKNINLLLVGYIQERKYFEHLRNQCESLPVKIIPNVSDIVPYYQLADVVVFPTLMEEGFGYTAIEAMACGKPVIFSNCPAVVEATNGIGIVVPKNDCHALSKALTDLMLNSSLRERLGINGREYVKERFGWQNVFYKYESVLSNYVE